LLNYRANNKSQTKISSPNVNIYDNSKIVNTSNNKKETTPYKNSKTLLQYQKHLIGNKETSKTLYDFQRLPLNKVKKTNTLKSQTSRPQGTFAENQYSNYNYKNNLQYNYNKNENALKNKSNSNQARAKSALRYKPNNNEFYQNGNRSFHNLEFLNANYYGDEVFANDPNSNYNDQGSSSDDLLKKYKKNY